MKAFIFDVDGTLVDSVAIHAETWQKALREFGHDINFDTLRSQIGKGGTELMSHVLSKDEVEAQGKEISARRADILKQDYLPKIGAFPKVRDLFERIRADGLRIALASSAHGEQLQDYKRKAHIEDFVEHETSSDDAERAKPHGDIFQAALDRLGDVAPEDAVVVGDTPYDAQAASKVGLRTIGLLSGGFDGAALREAGCIAIFDDPADLLDQFDALMRVVEAEGEIVSFEPRS